METVVSEKNVTKSVNSLAVTTAVTVARVEKEARVAREAITVVASEVITEEDLVVITEEDSVERVAREERVARVDTTTVDNTKYVNSSVTLYQTHHPVTMQESIQTVTMQEKTRITERYFLGM